MLRGTDNVQGQTSEHIFPPNGNYCLFYPSNLFRNARSFENWGLMYGAEGDSFVFPSVLMFPETKSRDIKQN